MTRNPGLLKYPLNHTLHHLVTARATLQCTKCSGCVGLTHLWTHISVTKSTFLAKANPIHPPLVPPIISIFSKELSNLTLSHKRLQSQRVRNGSYQANAEQRRAGIDIDGGDSTAWPPIAHTAPASPLECGIISTHSHMPVHGGT